MNKLCEKVFYGCKLAEVTGSNPVEALRFFRLLPSNGLNWKIYCDDHFSLPYITAVQYEFHIYFTLFNFHYGNVTGWLAKGGVVWTYVTAKKRLRMFGLLLNCKLYRKGTMR